MRTGLSVTSWKRSKTCDYFFGSDILTCLTSDNTKTIGLYVMHFAWLTKAFYLIKTWGDFCDL